MVDKRSLETTLDSVRRVHIPNPTWNVIEKQDDAPDRRQDHCSADEDA